MMPLQRLVFVVISIFSFYIRLFSCSAFISTRLLDNLYFLPFHTTCPLWVTKSFLVVCPRFFNSVSPNNRPISLSISVKLPLYSLFSPWFFSISTARVSAEIVRHSRLYWSTDFSILFSTNIYFVHILEGIFSYYNAPSDESVTFPGFC